MTTHHPIPEVSQDQTSCPVEITAEVERIKASVRTAAHKVVSTGPNPLSATLSFSPPSIGLERLVSRFGSYVETVLGAVQAATAHPHHVRWAQTHESGTAPEARLPASNLERFRAALQNRRSHTEEETYTSLEKQICVLLADEEDLTELGISPSLISFEGLIMFLRRNPEARHPNLSLDRNGRFIASWTPYPKARLSITFVGLTSAHWVAVDRANGARVQSSGEANPVKLSSVAAFSAWASRAG